jgi:4-hydroxybenzoate polyprenyltransferase
MKEGYTFKDKTVGFLTLIPPIFLFVTPFNAASAAVLSINGFPSLKLCIFGFLTAAFAAGGANIFNRYTDRERDKVTWPMRSIPSGRANAQHVLAVSISFYIIALVLCWIFFNPTSFIILLIAIILGSLYSLYLRDNVGYLTLSPIVGLIYLGSWAAFSPETLFTTFLPWYLFVLGLVWQSAHIMIHYVLYIKDDVNDISFISTPVFFVKPSPKAAIYMGLSVHILTVLLSVLLPFFAPLGIIYLIPVLAVGLYSLFSVFGLIKDTSNKQRIYKAWSMLAVFRLVISAAILLDVLLVQSLNLI